VLIDVPLHPSNASHSLTRSDSTPVKPIGFATTPRMRTGCASGPRIESARPVMRPTQLGSRAVTAGINRPDATATVIVLIFSGA
jgi:hypothetical protein